MLRSSCARVFDRDDSGALPGITVADEGMLGAICGDMFRLICGAILSSAGCIGKSTDRCHEPAFLTRDPATRIITTADT